MSGTRSHGLDEHPTVLAELAAGRVEYRFDRRGPDTVVVFYGGHMRAGLSLGEEVFAEAGCSVLVPSRPGYGRTPVATGGSAGAFADVTASLCAHLGITEVAAVVGVSGGGPTAVAMAARHPALVLRLILQSAVGPLPWPDRRTRLGARIVFAPRTERVSWALIHSLVRYAPGAGLRMLLRDLTLLPVRDVMAGLRPEDRARLISLFSRMRSGRGFTRDLKELAATGDLAGHAGRVSQPALVIATRQDAAVRFAHAQALASALSAELLESRADSHLIWFGRDWPLIAEQIHAFLTDGPSRTSQQH
ncbi:alpha/beta fold hydrolase [Streptomyces hokutonensis]|uniref:alpha/beta fold hydrolase n=1 Tax=Streptomyces hokutonensis TaxID=1306990 RepID=UPI0003A159F2|nr:alpha/beta hydrolase [Streptomyces hokutonensis]